MKLSKYDSLKKEILAHIFKTQKVAIYAHWKENLDVDEEGIYLHVAVIYEPCFEKDLLTYCCGAYEIGNIEIETFKNTALISKDLLVKYVSIRLDEKTNDGYLYQLTLPYKTGSGKNIKEYEIFAKAAELSGFKLVAKFKNPNSKNKLKHYIKFTPCS